MMIVQNSLTGQAKFKIQNYSFKFKIFLVLLTFNFVYTVSALLTFNLPKALAQSFSLSLSPPLLEIMIKPGKSITQAYEIINAGSALEITPRIVTFTPSGEHGNIFLGNGNYQLTPVHFSFQNSDILFEKPFFLNAGETRQVVLKISITPQAAENDYYFTLLFSSKPGPKTESLSSQQAGVIGSNLLITISEDGQPVKKGEIIEFKVKSEKLKIIDSFDKPEFLLRVKNTGKTLWKPFGQIKVQGLFGQKWEQEILPENVLGNSIRQLKSTTPSSLPTSNFQLPTSLFLLGPYRTNVRFYLDEDKQGAFLAAQTTFFALPIKISIFFLAFIIAVSIVKVSVKKYSKKHQRK